MQMKTILLTALCAFANPSIGFCEEDYKAQVLAGIYRAEKAVLGTLQAFQAPFRGTSAFCLSIESRSSQLDLDSIFRLLRDKDAEIFLPKIEMPRQADVRSSLGDAAYQSILESVTDAQEIKKTLACKSSKDEVPLRSKVLSIFRSIINAHSSVEADLAAINATANEAETLGLLTAEEAAELRK